MKKRVVVTGLGVVAPTGNNLETFRKSLQEGISGEGSIRRFDLEDFPVKRAFEVKNKAKTTYFISSLTIELILTNF